eukprot:jgi/Bigna1/134994/aug1.27_g9702
MLPSRGVLWGPSPIDWCEINMPESNFAGIQEFHNTWTNVAYMVVAIVLFLRQIPELRRMRDPGEKRVAVFLFNIYCASIFMTGVTSWWFHATLLFVAQKSDEFFENCAVLAVFYMSRKPLRVANISWTIVHCVLLFVGVFTIRELFCEVHLVAMVLCGLTSLRGRIAELENLADKIIYRKIRRRAIACAGLAGIGACAWLLDVFACKYVQNFNLHAFAWHIFTALSLHEAGVCAVSIIRCTELTQSNKELSKSNKEDNKKCK